MTGTNRDDLRGVGPLLAVITIVTMICLVLLGAAIVFFAGNRGGLHDGYIVAFPISWALLGLSFWVTQGPEPSRRLEYQPRAGAEPLPAPLPSGTINQIFLGLWGLSWAAIICFTGVFGLFLFLFVAALVFQALYVRRISRQEEVARVLNMAAVEQADMGSAIRALAAEYAEFSFKQFLIWLVSWLVLPGYVLMRNRGWRWDARLRRFASRLESGQSLPEAIGADATLLPSAYRVSQDPQKGLLALAGLLDDGPPQSSGVQWMEVFPRLIYPLIVVLLVCQVLTFHAIYVSPKIQKIFQDFGLKNRIFEAWYWFGSAWVGLYQMVGLALIAMLGTIIFMAVSGPNGRWWLPFARFFYRPEATGNFLKRFGLLLERHVSEVDALDALGESSGFPMGLRRRINGVLSDVRAGQPMVSRLAERLGLGQADRALLESSKRANQLPWVLREIGDRMIRVTIRRVQWASQFAMVLCVLLIGALVGMVCLSFFYPLIQLIEALA